MNRYGVPSASLLKEVQEKAKQTSLEKYGVDNPSKSDEIKEKIKQTNLEKYGVDYFSKTTEFKEKIKNTNQQLYGADWHVTTDDFKEKSRKTCLEKYGVDNAAKAEEIRNKKDNTMLEKYGAKSASQSSLLRQENIKKWGTELPCMSEPIKEKIKRVNIQKYGNTTYLHSETYNKMLIDNFGIQRPPTFKFKYDEILFDSSWELAFYVFHVSQNHNVIREPKSIEFIHNDKVHHYNPDFEVDGQLYEVKGEQFFKEDGTMCNPYDHNRDDIAEAKHQCGIKNNVIFIREKEIQPYLEYMKNNYGTDWKKKFQLKKVKDI